MTSSFLQLPEEFMWTQKDALKIRCRNCGENLKVDVMDLHSCGGAE